nr:MMPL family transporter [uncultured Halomonas sp.]
MPTEPPTGRSRALAWLWGLALLVCALATAWLLRDGLPTDTRLTAMLPEDRQAPLIERADANLSRSFENRFVVLLTAPDLQDAAQALAERLSRAGGASPLLSRLIWRDVDLADADPRKALDAYRYRLLTPALQHTIDSDGGASLVMPALRSLFSPTAQPQPVADPFGLLDAWLAARDDSRVEARDGLLTVTDDGKRYSLVIGELAEGPYSLPSQQALTTAIEDFQQAHPDASLLRSGLIFHAAAGAEQAKREVGTIGLGALLGLVIILLVVFRSPRVLAQMLLPLGCGLLLALPLTLALFGQLHVLTLAFGASLIGIAIDYALHLQCERAVAGHGFRLRPLLPGLALALISSLLAYLAQALTPLPGLRQMAIFAALGLLGAWLTVVLWLPRLATPTHPATTRIAERLWRISMPSRRLTPAGALIGAGLLGVLAAWQLTVNDSLRLLNPSSPAMLAEERQVQRLMGSDTGSRYLLVSANDEAALLARLAEIGDTLDRWIAEGASLRYTNLADSVPPPEVQRANLARVRQLYGEPLTALVTQAGLPESIAERARARLIDAPILDVATWLDSAIGEADRRLWLGSVDAAQADMANDESSRVAAVMPLSGSESATLEQRLADFAERHADVIHVDRVERLSNLLGELRAHIALWVGVALAGMAIVLAWRYRSLAWRVLVPPAGAVLIVLAIFGVIGVPLNVFSQLGMLLVLGIGLDAGIFNVEHARRPATWLAISLSTLTSLLAFGLLAFSATPALHHLGLTCLLGLAAVWLLVPWVRPIHVRSPREGSHDR